jgi:hypothetical protein
MQLRIADPALTLIQSYSILWQSTARLCCLAVAAASAGPLLAAAAHPPTELAQTPPAQAAPATILVELFTSEGCSSCPPADRLLAELDKKQPIPGTTIVVLSEHVDYWDQLGWRDPYSSRFWSERQDDYAAQFGFDSVYTPQMVIDGSLQASGGDSRAVTRAIKDAASSPHIDLAISRFERSAAGLKLEFTAGPAQGATLFAVVADDADRSSVQRGENAGHTLEHVAVARSLVRIADLLSTPLDKTATLSLPPDAANRPLRVILFARDKKSGHIVGVAAREL